MEQKKPKSSSQVHVLNKKIQMRFIPKNKKLNRTHSKQQQMKIPKSNNQQSGWNLWSFWHKLKPNQQQPQPKLRQRRQSFSYQRTDSLLPDHLDIQQSKTMGELNEQSRLKFACKLSSQHVLFGNQYQLDLINIGNITNSNYVQAQYMWSIRKNNKITHVDVDKKKMNLLVIVSGKLISIYRLDPRRIPIQTPNPFKQILLQQQPKYMKVLKDGNFGLFYTNRVQIYIVTHQVRRKFNRNYKIPQEFINNKQQFILVSQPQIYENVLSVFFQEVKPTQEKTFNLWSLQLQFLASQIKQIPLQKIYESKNKVKQTIKLYQYSKQIFLLNLGTQMLAIKKGYILDSANVNMKTQNSLIEYIGNDTLLYIRHQKIQVYDFVLNLSTKPFRINVKPRDSISLNNINGDDQYFKTIPILTSDFLYIYQKKTGMTKLKRFQFIYSLYLTRGMLRQQKMKMIFPKNLGQLKINDPILMDKCDIAQKMGYTTKQIYLQLWNRSSQSRTQDYSLLMATRNYQAIKYEIVRKLKKQSMLFKQIINIQLACITMLSQKIYSSQCTKQLLMDYISSHFFKRKLQMFKDIQQMQKFQKQRETGVESQQKLKMNIRQYQQYKNMQIKSQLITNINLLCHQNRKELAKQIRFLLRNFKFVFRVIYQQLLEQIIKNANINLLQLLKQIPEILPYLLVEVERPSHIPVGFYDGVWPKINQQQWKESLYIDSILTIDNQQIVKEHLIKNVTFKRNWLSQHDMVTKSVQQINKNYERITSQHMFYFFIAKLFQYINDKEVLHNIVNYIQNKYSDEDNTFLSMKKSLKPENSVRSNNLKSSMRSNKSWRQGNLLPGMPQNIKGKVFLYEKIYQFFVDKDIVPYRNGQICTLTQFFQLKDYELIKYCFQKQRSIKGLLLKNIKDIYKECLINHNQVFNKALLNYFIFPKSEISDLKYILNRINNEKKDFHKQNQDMYAVLIEALQRKLKIGTQNDIPIDQVLIYLENIPLKTAGINSSETNPTLEQLKAIQNINNYSDYLRNSKINMSLYDILHKPQQVFTKLINFQIQQSEYSQCEVWDSLQNFVQFAFDKLTQLQQFSQNIYHNRNTNNPINYQSAIFFVFLAKICEDISRIEFAKQLINHPLVKKRYDAFTAEGVVQHIYQWLFSFQSQFSKNKTYIKQLLTLLPPNSNTFIYISSQLQFANLLSHPNFILTYPISQSVLSFKDLKNIINFSSIDFILNHKSPQFDELMEKVYEVMRRIQDVIFEQTQRISQQQFNGMSMDPLRKITLHQVYEIFILKLLNQSKLKQVIPLIQKIMKIQCENPIYNIIYPILYIIQISNELNEGNKQNLIMCVWYYFYEPMQLMDILEYIMITPLSPHQMKNYIENSLQQGKKRHKGYNKDNYAFKQEYLTYANQNEDYGHVFMNIISKTTKHIQTCKQQFKHIKYSLIMAMLCNQPYALSKFISCSDQRNVKSIRSFLSYAIVQDIFQSLNLLQLGRRIFLVLLETDTKQFPIEAVINEFNKLDLTQDTQIYQYTPPEQNDTFQSVMWKSSQAFRKKKLTLRTEIETGGKKCKPFQKQEQRKRKIQNLFLNTQFQQDLKSKEPSSYIFSDSDNQEAGQVQIKQLFDRKKSKGESSFQPKAQREAIFESKKFKKPYSLYKSIQNQFGLGGNSRLFVSTKQPPSLSKISNLQINNNSDLATRKVRSSSMRSKQSSQKVLPLNKISLSHHYELDEAIGTPNLQRSLKPQDLQDQQYNSANSLPNIQKRKKQEMIQKLIPQMLKHSSIEEDLPQDYLVTTSHNQQKFIEADIDDVRQKNINIQQPQHEVSKASNDYFININQVDDIESDPQLIQFQQTHSQDFVPQFADIAAKLLQINKDAIQNCKQQQFQFQIIDKYQQNQYALKQIIKQIYNQNQHENNVRISNILYFIGEIVGRYMELKISSSLFDVVKKIQQVQSKTISEIKFTDLFSGEALVKQYKCQKQIFDQIYSKLIKFVDSQNIYTIQKFIHKVFNNFSFEQLILWDFILNICEQLASYQQQQKQWNLQKIRATLPKINITVWNNKFQTFQKKVLKSKFRDEILQTFCSIINQYQQKSESIKFLIRVKQICMNRSVERKLNQLENS